MKKLQYAMQGKLFWITLIILGLSLELIAVFYQYVLDEPPCILCIHFRLLVVLLIIFAFLGLLFRSTKRGRILLSSSLLVIFAGMLERAYVLLGTERGFVKGECAATLNFPDWIAVDKWLPSFFEPWTSCGQTPQLFLGITMAEALTAFSAIMLLLAVAMLIASFRRITPS
jgi:disulfide bond formation protein DsbB